MDNLINPVKNVEKMPVTEAADFESGEKKYSVATETGENNLPIEKSSAHEAPMSVPAGIGAPGIDSSKSPLHQNVEAILEDDLADLYSSLDPKKQQEFKTVGEKTANKIINLIHTAKATFRKVFSLIFKWLKIIPGVNRHFLEQEAKLKADRILEIK